MASLDFQPSLTDLPAGALVHILGLLKSLKDISSAQIVATSIADAANVSFRSGVHWMGQFSAFLRTALSNIQMKLVDT